MDYRAQWADLEASQNPFAIVVMAHLKALESQHDAGDRRVWKVTLMRKLLAKGYERQQILDLLRFIDWIMTLPEEVEREIWAAAVPAANSTAAGVKVRRGGKAAWPEARRLPVSWGAAWA